MSITDLQTEPLLEVLADLKTRDEKLPFYLSSRSYFNFKPHLLSRHRGVEELVMLAVWEPGHCTLYRVWYCTVQ